MKSPIQNASDEEEQWALLEEQRQLRVKCAFCECGLIGLCKDFVYVDNKKYVCETKLLK